MKDESLAESRTVLAFFSDQLGIGRLKSKGATFHVVIDNVHQWQENSDSSSAGFNFNDSGDIFVNRLLHAVEQSGTRRIEDMDWKTSTFIDYDSNVVVSLFYIPSDNTNVPNIVLAGGKPAVNIPKGKASYNGHNVISTRTTGRIDIGTFNMNVDFENGTGTINGNTSDSMDLQVRGSFAIDPINATFFSDELTLSTRSVFAGSNTARASLYGSFHGDDATGVSGVYHNNAESPGVFGFIIGSRQDIRNR